MRPYEKSEFLITLESVKSESVEEFFEIIVKDSDS